MSVVEDVITGVERLLSPEAFENGDVVAIVVPGKGDFDE